MGILKRLVMSIIKLIIAFIVFLAALIFLADAYTSAPIYQGDKSSHFDGEKFSNRLDDNKNLKSAFRFFVNYRANRVKWPDWVENKVPDGLVKPSKLGERSQALRITFINHSSFLIQVDGLNILSDPVFSQRVSPFSIMGPKRVRKPAIELEQLPPIDIILVSHNHYDHLDIDSLKKISLQTVQQKKQESNAAKNITQVEIKNESLHPLILTGLGNDLYLKQQGLKNVQALDWDASQVIGPLEIYFKETRHRSGRGLSDQMKTLWGAFAIKASSKLIYFAGDTGYGSHFRDAQQMHGDFDVALLSIGAYEPRWFMRSVHLNPDDAVKAHLDLGARSSIGMHFATFQLTEEAIDAPLEALKVAKDKYKISGDAFVAPYFGQTFEVN